MTTHRSLTALCVLLCVAAWAPLFAGDKPKDLIVGKWEPAEKKEMGATLEFLKDGKLKVSVGTINVDGTYKFVDDTNVEVEMTFMGQTQKEKLKTMGGKPFKFVEQQRGG